MDLQKAREQVQAAYRPLLPATYVLLGTISTTKVPETEACKIHTWTQHLVCISC